MDFIGKRTGYGLGAYTIAKELGIDYKKYLDVEKGLLKLDAEKLEKFNEILTRATELKFENIEKMKKIDEDVKSGKLKEIMKAKGYTTRSLAQICGCAQPTICNVINYSRGSKSIKECVYDFLNDPLNDLTKEKSKSAKKYEKKTKNELKSDYNALYNYIITNYSFKAVVEFYKLLKENFEKLS